MHLMTDSHMKETNSHGRHTPATAKHNDGLQDIGFQSPQNSSYLAPAMFCRSPPVTSDQPRRPNVHISDARRLAGT